jgi:hypothetical protein
MRLSLVPRSGEHLYHDEPSVAKSSSASIALVRRSSTPLRWRAETRSKPSCLMHSADRVHPEWQDLEVGDVLRSRADRPGVRVEILERERTLSNRSEAGDWVWTFVLEPENGSTRLISRNRIAIKGAAAGQSLGMLVMEPGSLVMERKMLLRIKERAERFGAEQRAANQG